MRKSVAVAARPLHSFSKADTFLLWQTASHLWAEMIEDVLEAEVIEVEAEL